MRNKRIVLIAVSVVVAVGLGFMLGARRSSDDLTIPVVRTYMVPVDRTEEIKAQINRLFEGKDGVNQGRAQVFANGLMVVRATEGAQRGIHRMIEQIEAIKSAPRQSVHLEYWVVTGQEDKTSNASSLPGLTDPLTAIAKMDGARKFRILDHLSTNSMSGLEMKIQSAVAEIVSIANLNGDMVNLRLEFQTKLGQVKSDVQVKQGEFLILGQNSADSLVQDHKITNGSMNVYYIVRAELSK